MKKPILATAGLLIFILFATPVFGQIKLEPFKSPPGFKVYDLVEAADNELFVISSGGIFRSTDAGDNWQSVDQGLINYNGGSSVTHFARTTDDAIFLQADSRLYRYNPTAKSWDFLPLAPIFIRISADSQNQLWLIESKGDTYVSNDGGATFVQVLTDAQVPGTLVENFVVWNDEHGLIETWPGGWYHFNRNGEVQKVNLNGTIHRLRYHPKTGVAYAQITGGKLFRSLDGGLNWQQVSINSTSEWIFDLVIDPNGGIYATDSDGKLYHSTDNGSSWQALNTPYTKSGSLDFRLMSKTGRIYCFVYNCGNHIFYRSSDLGQNWTELDWGLTMPSVRQIAQDRFGRLYVSGCINQGWRYTTDQGTNWDKLPPLHDSLAVYDNIQISTQGTLLAYGLDKLAVSSDNGVSWTTAALPNVSTVAGAGYRLWLKPDGTIYAFYFTSMDRKLYQAWMSVDEGNSWKPLNIPAGSVANWNLPKSHPNGDLFFLTDTTARLVHYMAKLDSTRIIAPLNHPYYLQHIDARGYLYFVPPGGGLNGFISKDLGTTTAPLYLPNISFFTMFASNLDGDLFVADYDNLFVSKTGGQSWYSVLKRDSDLPEISTLYISPDQYLYLGFYGDTLLRSTLPTAYTRLISGQVWLDQNDDCELDTGELGIAFAKITAQSTAITRTGHTGYDGHYVLSAPPGDYQLSVEPPNAMQSECYPDWPVSLPASADTAQADLPMRIVADCPYMTVAFSSPFLRRCFENTYRVRCCNEGTAIALGASVDIKFDSLLEIQNTTLPFQVSGQTYTFQLGDLAPGACLEFDVRVKVSCMAELGQEHCVSAHIYPDAICLAGLDTLFNYTECQNNIGSFDPNDKRAFVTGRQADESVDPGVPLEYLIRFQNTGTDTAFRVVVEDRISPWLDLASLRVEATSHPYRLEQEDGRLFRFVFENILLPDSNINEAASHGFIKFSIAQSAKVPLGATVANRADIFFDFNDPVRTNTSRLTVGKIGPPFVPGDNRTVLVYPNPFRNQTYMRVKVQDGDGSYTLKLFDALGRLARQESHVEPAFYFERRGLPGGLYYFMVETAGRRVGSGKLLVH